MIKSNPIFEKAIENLTLIRTVVNPPANAGMDATKICVYLCTAVSANLFIPRDADVTSVKVPDVGELPNLKWNGTDVFFHDGIEPVLGTYVYGRVEIYLRTWEPVKTEQSIRKDGFKNYAFFLDVHKTDNPDAGKEVVVHNPQFSHPRYRNMIELDVFTHENFETNPQKKRVQHIEIKNYERRSRRTIAAM